MDIGESNARQNKFMHKHQDEPNVSGPDDNDNEENDMSTTQSMYDEGDAPYERFGELTVQDLIDLLNRRVTFRKEQQGPTPGRKDYTDLQIRAKGSEQELHHLLDRITAHKMNIRAITND